MFVTVKYSSKSKSYQVKGVYCADRRTAEDTMANLGLHHTTIRSVLNTAERNGSSWVIV